MGVQLLDDVDGTVLTDQQTNYAETPITVRHTFPNSIVVDIVISEVIIMDGGERVRNNPAIKGTNMLTVLQNGAIVP